MFWWVALTDDRKLDVKYLVKAKFCMAFYYSAYQSSYHDWTIGCMCTYHLHPRTKLISLYLLTQLSFHNCQSPRRIRKFKLYQNPQSTGTYPQGRPSLEYENGDEKSTWVLQTLENNWYDQLRIPSWEDRDNSGIGPSDDWRREWIFCWIVLCGEWSWAKRWRRSCASQLSEPKVYVNKIKCGK